MALHQQIPGVTAFFKGGAPKAPAPPKPPSPTQAAANYSASDINMRQRRAHGYSSTILGGYDNPGQDRPGSLLKSLLGQ